MLDPSQVSVLSEMGIPVWQLRQSGTPASAVINVFDEDDIDISQLLARVNASTWLLCHDGDESQQTQRLLHAILLAIGLGKEVCLLSVNELKAIEPEALTDSGQKRLVIFGESIVKQVLGSESTIENLRYEPQQALQSKLTTFVSLSFETILDQPVNKKQVWQDIRQIKQFNN